MLLDMAARQIPDNWQKGYTGNHPVPGKANHLQAICTSPKEIFRKETSLRPHFFPSPVDRLKSFTNTYASSELLKPLSESSRHPVTDCPKQNAVSLHFFLPVLKNIQAIIQKFHEDKKRADRLVPRKFPVHILPY